MSVTAVSSLITSIKARAASVLGATYSEIAYAADVTKNSFKGNAKRYGVLPGSASEVTGNTRAITLDQTFEVVLTDSFMNTAMSDSSEQAVRQTLQEKSLDVYQDLVSTKCGANSAVLLVSELDLSDPETIENNVTLQRSRFKVKYRISL